MDEQAGELTWLTWVNDREQTDASAAADDAYRTLDTTLRRDGATVLQERVYGSLAVAGDVLRARERATGAGSDAWAMPPTVIDGSPTWGAGLAGIHVLAARGGRSRPVVRDGHVLGRLVETPAVRLIGLSDVGRTVATTPGTPADETRDAIEAAEQALSSEGFSFRDVARTWYHLRDILAWYGAFNGARNAVFTRMGLIGPSGDGAVPASTGIAGRNARGGWCALDLLAARSTGTQPLAMTRLHNRRQNEATGYGSAFARGMSLTIGAQRHLLVSGTASIDDHGKTVHVGDFDAQTTQTIGAIQALLEGAGATLADIRQAVCFVQDRGNSGRFARHLERAGLHAVPPVIVEADVCRDDLLVEIEVAAIVAAHPGERA